MRGMGKTCEAVKLVNEGETDDFVPESWVLYDAEAIWGVRQRGSCVGNWSRSTWEEAEPCFVALW